MSEAGRGIDTGRLLPASDDGLRSMGRQASWPANAVPHEERRLPIGARGQVGADGHQCRLVEGDDALAVVRAHDRDLGLLTVAHIPPVEEE